MKNDTGSILEEIKNEQDFFKKAKLISYLKKERNLPLSQISQKLNIKPSYLSHILRLNRLPELIIDGYYAGQVSKSHLFIIARLKSEEQILQVYEKVLSENLSAQQTDAVVREVLYQVKHEGSYLSREEIDDFQRQLGKDSEVRAKVIQTRIKGKLILEIKGGLTKTTNELRRIIKLLKNK